MSVSVSPDGIGTLRKRIDAIDENLLSLLAERLSLCRRVGRLKQQMGMPMMQPGRIAEVTDRIANSAVQCGLSAPFARELWNLIIREACRLEESDSDGHA